MFGKEILSLCPLLQNEDVLSAEVLFGGHSGAMLDHSTEGKYVGQTI